MKICKAYKSRLNRSIIDQGWFEFRRKLNYKLTWKGGWLVKIPPKNTSRACPICGCIAKENRKTQAQFWCIECGFKGHADLVGAINIQRAGHARFACEVSGVVMPPAAGTFLQIRNDVKEVQVLPRPTTIIFNKEYSYDKHAGVGNEIL